MSRSSPNRPVHAGAARLAERLLRRPAQRAEPRTSARRPACAAPAPQPRRRRDFPWHDPALPIDERLKLAEGRTPQRRLMAAMAQLDCGACGYLCKTYAEAIASGDGRGPDQVRSRREADGEAPEGAGGRGAAASGARGSGIVPDIHRARTAAGRSRPPGQRAAPWSEPLNRAGAEKQTQNVVLSLAGTGLDYAPGDSLGVWPINQGEEVELVLAILRAKGSEEVALPSGATLTVREALLKRCNLREPSDELLLLLSRTARDDIEATRLARMADDTAGPAAAGVHDVFDLLVKFRSARPPIVEFVQALAPLQPRLYSIASSLKCHPAEVHLTVAVVRYDLHARGYQGVASCFFADRLRRGARVPVYVQRAHGFGLPTDPAAPIVMIGPGTGVAPFRAFLQERAATGAPGKSWLFFGNTRRELDFLYRGELEGYLRKGALARLDTAFSRDQGHKVYVQHRLREQGAELWRWFEEGAYIYVCGDAQRMAKDVDEALKGVVAEHGAMSAEKAAEYVARLAKAGRYARDVY